MKLQRSHGIIKAKLGLINPSVRLSRELKLVHTHPNPEYLNILRYSPYGYVSPSMPKTVELWEEDGNVLWVPRGTDVNALTRAAKIDWSLIDWKDQRTKAPVEFPKLLVTLNKEQQYLLKQFRKFIYSYANRYGVSVFISPTGTGKTMFQAAAAKETGQRTLILCLTEMIKRAWYEDLRTAFGYSPKEIGLIQQSTFRIGEHFTIASIKTLIKRKHLWPEIFKQIGCVVVDEAHTIAAPMIKDFVFECPSLFVFGATATPPPAKIAFYFYGAFGNVEGRVTAQQKDTQTSMALQRVDEIDTAFVYKPKREGMIDWTHLSEELMADEERNALIVHHAARDYKKGEAVLVVTKRIPHVMLLAEMLKEKGIEDTNIITGETNSDRFYTEKLIESVAAGTCRMIVASSRAIELGANINNLSVIHIGIPPANRNSLEQLIGRIRRTGTDKSTCRCTYYVDRQTAYLKNVFNRVAIPTFRKLRVAQYKNIFAC